MNVSTDTNIIFEISIQNCTFNSKTTCIYILNANMINQMFQIILIIIASKSFSLRHTNYLKKVHSDALLLSNTLLQYSNNDHIVYNG